MRRLPGQPPPLRRDPDVADVFFALQAALYVALLAIVLVRLALRWRRAPRLERLQLTPVYVCGLVTFLIAAVGTAGAGDAVVWAGFIATALLPFAFLGGLLRSHVAFLDAQLRARLEELQASRVRIVEAGDAERKRIERDLHDGAQSRLVALALLLVQLRKRVGADAEAAALLERAQAELQDEPRRAARARARHPPADAHRARAPAGAQRARRPRARPGHRRGRRRRAAAGPVEIAAYFVVSEALTNVAKYAQATEANVAVRRGTGTSPSRSATTAWAARTSRAARACAGSATASPRSTARSRSTAHPARDAGARRDPAQAS